MNIRKKSESVSLTLPIQVRDSKQKAAEAFRRPFFPRRHSVLRPSSILRPSEELAARRPSIPTDGHAGEVLHFGQLPQHLLPTRLQRPLGHRRRHPPFPLGKDSHRPHLLSQHRGQQAQRTNAQISLPQVLLHLRRFTVDSLHLRNHAREGILSKASSGPGSRLSRLRRRQIVLLLRRTRRTGNLDNFDSYSVTGGGKSEMFLTYFSKF